MDLISKLFGSGVGSVVDSVANAADKFITTKAEKEEFKAELARIAQEGEKIAIERERQYLADVASARAMQSSALNQSDLFSKRFVYYLASFIIISATIFGISLMYYEIPEGNKRMVEMFFDIYLFSGALTVIYFFFGSSSGSHDKNSILRKQSETK